MIFIFTGTGRYSFCGFWNQLSQHLLFQVKQIVNAGVVVLMIKDSIGLFIWRLHSLVGRIVWEGLGGVILLEKMLLGGGLWDSKRFASFWEFLLTSYLCVCVGGVVANITVSSVNLHETRKKFNTTQISSKCWFKLQESCNGILFQAYVSPVKFGKKFSGDISSLLCAQQCLRQNCIKTLCRIYVISFMQIFSIDWLYVTS